jgi:hypothetical protein
MHLIMSLLHYRMVVHHLVVMEALHEVQFIACICCIIPPSKNIPDHLRICHVYVDIDNAVSDCWGIQENPSPSKRRV